MTINPSQLLGNHSIQPASGYYENNWPASGAYPQAFSVGGWTTESRRINQQTFLGASIVSFNMNGGFGDNSSTLSVELVNDEYNVSDKTSAGFGDDPYHSGLYDRFASPMVGSPVFFKFGENFATIQEAYVQTLDDLYGITSTTITPSEIGSYNIDNFTNLPNNQYVDVVNNKIFNYEELYNNTNYRGRNHLVFGGILQSYVENKGPGGNPAYSIKAVDPREILSNVTLILNNYSGPTYNSNNLINIYGFLEYNPSESTKASITGVLPHQNDLKRFIIDSKNITPTDKQKTNIINDVLISYSGDDSYRQSDPNRVPPVPINYSKPISFPITGTGFSRRSDQGIPYYRIKQAVNSIMGYDGLMPQEYYDQGFGGKINFRGFNYVIDFGTLPDLPQSYFIDFDQITLLDLILEICDVTNRDLFVTLLPVIDHPRISILYNYNNDLINKSIQQNNPNIFATSGVAGIIRIDTIDRSTQPNYGSIKKYIDSLSSSGIYVENKDIGFELSNITTDKFIVGAQEVKNYFFTNQTDRDHVDAIIKREDETLPRADRWKLETALKQQVLPYYGLLGKNAVTIPKGFGAYQQILLDSTGLNANGVGSYYVATEMELRCALVSFERWKEFLLQYNDIYLESIEINDVAETAYMIRAVPQPGFPPVDQISNNYAVTVPRSVFDSYALEPYGEDKLPKSPCNPPYGYPLYYKRATKIGIPEAGLTQVASKITSAINSFQMISSADKSTYKLVLNSEFTRLRDLKAAAPQGKLSIFEQNYFDLIETALKPENIDSKENIEKAVILMSEFLSANVSTLHILTKQSKKNIQNALKVYDFIKSIAEECLGKKFLVKIPVSTNLWHSNNIEIGNEARFPNIYTSGPFGFKPLPNNSLPGYEFTKSFTREIEAKQKEALNTTIDGKINNLQLHLNSGIKEYFQGSLKANYDPIEDKHEFNYEPMNNGGFFDFDLMPALLNRSGFDQIESLGYKRLPTGIQNGLIPIDLNNFITENGRVGAYVRFDNSQYLSFENFNSQDFIQEEIKANHSIPDVSESLDNVKDTTEFKFPSDEDLDNKPKQIAFVKCQIDDKLYMPPKTVLSGVQVHGREYTQTPTFVPPRKIYDPCSDEYYDSFSYFTPVFVPKVDGIKVRLSNIRTFNVYKDEDVLKSYIIKTDLQSLDTQNVYALITLPSKAIPLKDSRYRDGFFQTLNAETFKHVMTEDTVHQETDGFDTPTTLKDVIVEKEILKDIVNCNSPQNVDALDKAWFVSRKALKSLRFSFPNQIKYTSPSPIYPDLVCLPLMSKERCYGPWISSQLDNQASVYKNVGGKIEFIKDENLAPWNYSGYQLMNEAALAQAEFAQSLLLFSERGGFVVPGIPPNVSLGRSLLTLGPLVTDLQVDVSTGGIKTTVKLDLYTANFGKLQKQKQDQISRLSRERQKLKDERNALIRKGLGKSQKSINYLNQYETMKTSIDETPFGGKGDAIGTIVMGVDRVDEKRWSSETDVHNTSQFAYNGSIQTNSTFGQVAQSHISENQLASDYQNTAAQSVDQMYLPASQTPDHPNMPSFIPSNNSARNNLYG